MMIMKRKGNLKKTLDFFFGESTLQTILTAETAYKVISRLVENVMWSLKDVVRWTMYEIVQSCYSPFILPEKLGA